MTRTINDKQPSPRYGHDFPRGNTEAIRSPVADGAFDPDTDLDADFGDEGDYTYDGEDFHPDDEPESGQLFPNSGRPSTMPLAKHPTLRMPDGQRRPTLKHASKNDSKGDGFERQDAGYVSPDMLPVDHHQARERARSLLDDGRAAASSVIAATRVCEKEIVAAKAKRDENLLVALEKTFELHRYLEDKPVIVRELLRENGKSITVSTKGSRFLDTVRLVFGDSSSSTQSRYAGVLRYVEDNQRDEQSFEEVIEFGGGIVACLKSNSKHRQGPARQRAMEKLEKHVEALAASGLPYAVPAVENHISSRFTTILIERLEDGTCKQIGYRPEEDEAVVKRYRAIDTENGG